MTLHRAVFAALALLFPLSALCAQAKLRPLENDFVSACVQAFQKSAESGGAENEAARPICECAAHERRGQKVSDSALKHETAEIRKDPKHVIQDRGLRGALQYCAVELMQSQDEH